jgi:hypothetical protein
MFYDDADMIPVVDSAVNVFGKVGTYAPTPCVYTSVWTNKFGTIWYGDVEGDISVVTEKAHALTKLIRTPVVVYDMGTDTEIART